MNHCRLEEREIAKEERETERELGRWARTKSVMERVRPRKRERELERVGGEFIALKAPLTQTV